MKIDLNQKEIWLLWKKVRTQLEEPNEEDATGENQFRLDVVELEGHDADPLAVVAVVAMVVTVAAGVVCTMVMLFLWLFIMDKVFLVIVLAIFLLGSFSSFILGYC